MCIAQRGGVAESGRIDAPAGVGTRACAAREPLRRLALDDLREAFLADCRARGLSPRTLEHYSWSLASYRQFLGSAASAHSAADLELGRAREWAASLAATRSPASIGNAVAGLRVFTRWLVAEDYLRADPLARLAKPKAPPPVVHPPVQPGDGEDELLSPRGGRGGRP